MTKKSYETKLAKIDRALLMLAKKREGIEVCVVQNEKQESDIRSKFSTKSSAKVVLIKCY